MSTDRERPAAFGRRGCGGRTPGIGAHATGFSIVSAAFLRGRPYPDSERLYVVTSWQTAGGTRSADVSPPEQRDFRGHTRNFELAAFAEASFNISDERALPEQAAGAWLSADVFRVLQLQPVVGRDFDIQTVDELLASQRWPYRVYGSLFAVLAVIPPCAFIAWPLRIDGTCSDPEDPGNWRAHGAERRQVSWLILEGGLVQSAIGLPIGLAGAVMLGVVLERTLAAMRPQRHCRCFYDWDEGQADKKIRRNARRDRPVVPSCRRGHRPA